MPYPKRRSCSKCVQAKRKCSLDLPRCQRCNEKNLQCIYSADTLPSTRPAAATMPTPESATDLLWPPSTTLQTAPPLFSNGLTMGLTPISNGLFDPTLDSPFDTSIDWLANITTPPSLAFDSLLDRPSLAQQIEHDNSVISGEMYMPRVRYVVSRLKTWPLHFVRRGCNSFIHRNTLVAAAGGGAEEVDVVLDALSACALYAVRGEGNERAVFEDLRRKVRRTVERGERPWGSPGELLVHAQVLLLYQIIRLFDGDIRLRAEAEADAVVQVRWTVELLMYFRPLKAGGDGVDVMEGVEGPKMDWQEWLFDESVRRTILTSYMIQGVYSFLKEGMDPVCGKVEKLSFTARAELWEAPSEFRWNDAWAKKPPYEIRISEWDADAAGIGLGECDELGLIMMAVIKDLDLTSQWVGNENLVRCGLDWESTKRYIR